MAVTMVSVVVAVVMAVVIALMSFALAAVGMTATVPHVEPPGARFHRTLTCAVATLGAAAATTTTVARGGRV